MTPHRRTLRAVLPAALALVLGAPAGAADESADYEAMRAQFAAAIDFHVRLTAEQTGVEALDQPVLDALTRVPRHAFVPKPLRPLAYADVPLPVGHGQNISQPFVIALMTQLARVGKDDVVFETCTGAGYQAAILSLLAKRVYSVEYVEALARTAAVTIERLGYLNVEIRVGDGYYGWAAGAPYDAIIVKEAVHHVPEPLLAQLKPGGRLVIPVGPQDGVQMLTLIEKQTDGSLKETHVLPVRFGPLPGGERI